MLQMTTEPIKPVYMLKFMKVMVKTMIL